MGSMEAGSVMQIPKRFRLMGQIIEVTSDQNDFIEEAEATGLACYRESEIKLNPALMSYRKQYQREQIFLHELVHFITYYAQESVSGKKNFLHQEEGFVDTFAHLLHQALTTMEYE
jgi:cell fate (sporulation/competence/biofilm development) regulator YlbF (YheA/YmcA/DUF963 family)